LIVTHLVKECATFIEPEGLLPFLKKPANGPYMSQPNPVRPNDHYLPNVYLNAFHLRLGLPNDLLTYGFTNKTP